MNRWLACSLAGTIAAFTVVSLSTAGCGGSTGSGSDSGPDNTSPDHKAPPPGDSGTDHHVGKDAAKDSIAPFDSPGVETGGEGDDGGTFMIPAEGGPTVPAAAKQILNTVDAGFGGAGLFVVGVTDDGYAIFYGNTGSKTPLMAVPVAGGAPITISADIGTTSSNPIIVHDTVFVLTSVTNDMTTGNGIGTLTYWTKANGAQATAAKAVDGVFAASPDGTKVVYTANASSDGQTGDLVAQNSDGTGKTTLVTGTATNGVFTQSSTMGLAYYDPYIGFTNNTYFVASHQEGTTSSVSFWDTATWTKHDLVAGAAGNTGSATPPLTSGFAWSTSTTGATSGNTIVAATSAGALQAFVLPATTAVPVDTGVSAFFMTADGSKVFYGTPAGAYKMATLPVPVPTTILTTGFGGFDTGFSSPVAGITTTPPFSPDGNWSVFYKIPGTTAGTSDINIVKSVASATPVSILTATTATVNNDAFTTDSAYSLYFSNYTSTGTGQVKAWPVAGSAGITVAMNNAWNNWSLPTGAEILYQDNWMMLGTNNGIADISKVDVSAATLVPVPIISAADQGIYLTPNKATLVFSLIAAGNTKTNGIYAIAP